MLLSVPGSWRCFPSSTPKAEAEYQGDIADDPLPADSTFVLGDLVGTVIDRVPKLGVVRRDQGHRVGVQLCGEERLRTMAPRELILLGRDATSAATSVSSVPWHLHEDGPPSWASCRELGAAWLLLLGGEEHITLEDLKGLLVTDQQPTSNALLWVALHGQQDFFRLGRELRVQVRPLRDLRRLRHQRRRERLSRERRHRWLEALASRDPDRLSEALHDADAHSGQDLRLLQGWAASADASLAPELPADLCRTLQRAGVSMSPVAIRRLLIGLKRWNPHSLRCMDGTPWVGGFNAALLREAERLVAIADRERPGDEARCDLCQLRCFTLDDPGTEEIDDAVGIGKGSEGGALVWVHIADPARLVEVSSPLDLEARRRGTSLYLASGTIPMFPMSLAQGPFSLRQGKRCPALSAAIHLAEDGALETVKLMRSWIWPTYRLSYEEGDELLELAPPGDDDLSRLERLLDLHRNWRSKHGALLMEQSEGRIRREGQQAVVEIVEPTRARAMVAEAMVLMGEAVAKAGENASLCLPYRSQAAAELPPASELVALPTGAVRNAAIKRCLSRGTLGTRPQAHFSLGLASYVQATSPIRRYADLICHRQLQANLVGGEPLGKAELRALLDDLDSPLRRASQIAREDQRHWQQVWFEQHAESRWRVVFLRWLRPQDELGLVRLQEEHLDVAADCPRLSQPGDALLLQVRAVDSIADQLQLEAIKS